MGKLRKCEKKVLQRLAKSKMHRTHAPHTAKRMVWTRGFRVPVRALKLKPLLKCEIIIQINIKQTKLHASIQHI